MEMQEKVSDLTGIPAGSEARGFASRLSLIKRHRRGLRARTIAGELGWLLLILSLSALLLAQFGTLIRG
jgi:hypothetical protein